MRSIARRVALLSGICVLPFHACAAWAQDAAPKDGEEIGIVVTGVRASLRSAAQQKKAAVSVVDAITAEDIGKFPTENVADASQRITGVQITRTRGSGTGASIRGLPTEFTRVQLNGSTLSSSIVDLRGGGAGGDISRSFDFRLLPTEFVSAVEVVKSQTADMQEGGLSGAINVKTVRPLDLKETTAVVSAFGVWNSNAGKVTPQATGLFSTTFADGRGGFLIGGGYSDTKAETHSVLNAGWSTTREATFGQDINSDGDKLDTFNIPGQVRTEIARERRQRAVLTGVLEFEATDTLKLSAEGFYSRFHVQVDSLENLFIFTSARGGVLDPASTKSGIIPDIAANQLAAGIPFATTLGLSNVDVRANDRDNDSVAKTYFAKASAEFDNDRISGGINFAYSKSQQVGDNLNLAQIQRFGATYDCTAGQEICGVTIAPGSQGAYLDPTQGIVASLNGAFGRKTQDEVKELKADLRYEMDDSFVRRISVGGAATWRGVFADATTLVVSATALAPLAGLVPTTVQASGFSIVPYSQIAAPSRGDFLGAYNGNQAFPSAWLATNTKAILAAVPRDKLAAVAGAVQPNLSSVVNVNERIFAGYVQADFGTSDDRLTGNVGVRLVNTREQAAGQSPNLGGLIIQIETGGTVTVPPAGPVTSNNSYTYLLPAANLKFMVTDDFIVRLAGSKTMSRPTLTQISPSTSVTGGSGNYTITSGNPDLKPFLSTNFDFSAEWYPNSDTALTFAAFYKSLASLVFPATDQVTLPVTFFTASTNTNAVRDQVFQRNRPTNGAGVKVKGFEIGFQQAMTFLPGLLEHTGVQANYTYISNNKPQILTAASKNNFNLGAYYDDGKIAARASYTWRDKFVSAGLPGGYNGLGVTTLARGTLDVNLTYNISDRLAVIFEGSNMLDQVDKSQTTLGNLPVDYYDPGHQFMIGARFKY